jgi:predicted GH43/DUF377 family glycosyl hydrolase
MIENLSKIIIQNGGIIKPIVLPIDSMPNPAIMNPSIINANGSFYMNIRNTNYALYHAEKNLNEHIWGPLCYLHPENQMALITYNILCKLDDNFDIVKHSVVDTKKIDAEKPAWHFIGLEDARLCYWNDKLYLCGVRRDTKENGEGRMELSEIKEENDSFVEISRKRMPAPGENDSYCEKNWMPILDIPYHFIKWSNPTEVVKYDTNTETTQTTLLTEQLYFPGCGDIRGGSQIIKFGDNYLALTHEVALYSSEAGRKDGDYYHRFVVWDSNFRIIKISDRFNFLGAKIEFSCGICLHENNLIVPFAFQDNASFIISIPVHIIHNLLQ